MAGHRNGPHPLRGKTPPWVKPKDPNRQERVSVKVYFRKSTWEFFESQSLKRNLTVSALVAAICESWRTLWVEETRPEDIPLAPQGLLPEHYSPYD